MSRPVREIVFCCIKTECGLHSMCVAGSADPAVIHKLDIHKPHLSLAFIEKERGSSVYEVRCRDWSEKK